MVHVPAVAIIPYYIMVFTMLSISVVFNFSVLFGFVNIIFDIIFIPLMKLFYL